MKVGIISMQRVVNYGSFLQAYSLKSVIEKLGHEVEFVDYEVEVPIIEEDKKNEEPDKKQPGFFNKAFRYIWEHRSKKAIKLRNYYRAKMYLTDRYNNEFLPLLGISDEHNYHAKEDAIVIGSDEVFNCLQANKDVGYSKDLFGRDANADILISYAASFGTTTLSGLKEFGIDNEIANMLSEFDAISVRDKNSVEIIKELEGFTPEYHIDPVLLSDYEGLIPNEVELKDYLIVYAYGGRINDIEAKAINDFAASKNLKVITIGETNRFEWDHLLLTPFEVLAYFINASYIVTDTFHGSVFSLKYNKKFATIIRDGNRQKLTDLLDRFGLLERQVTDIEKLPQILESNSDFDKVNEIIKKERDISVEYLKKNLNVIK